MHQNALSLKTRKRVPLINMNALFSLYYQILETLQRQSGEIFEEFSDQIQCKKGCSGCCINGFRIRYMEGLTLLQGFTEASPETASKIMDNLNDPKALACPVLINGACSLYEHRPALCRAYGIILQLDDTLATCNLNFQDPPLPNRPLKQMDIVPYYEVIDDLSQKIWDVHPLPTLSKEKEAPLFDIQQLFKAFIKAQSEESQPACQSRL